MAEDEPPIIEILNFNLGTAYTLILTVFNAYIYTLTQLYLGGM